MIRTLLIAWPRVGYDVDHSLSTETDNYVAIVASCDRSGYRFSLGL